MKKKHQPIPDQYGQALAERFNAALYDLHLVPPYVLHVPELAYQLGITDEQATAFIRRHGQLRLGTDPAQPNPVVTMVLDIRYDADTDTVELDWSEEMRANEAQDAMH